MSNNIVTPPKLNNNNNLINPYGDLLINLLNTDLETETLWEYANKLSSVQISDRMVCDLELLATGAFSPLDRFMGKSDFERVVAEMRLENGLIFPMPIHFPVENLDQIKLDSDIALRDSRNNLLAIMTIEEIYEWSKKDYLENVIKSTDSFHPLVSEIAHWGNFNISGKLKILNLPERNDFQNLRLTPKQVREKLNLIGNPNVVAFQTRNPIHRAHEELTKRAIEKIDGTLLLHPVVGMTKHGDIDYFTRVRTYQSLVKNHYQTQSVTLSLLPLAMRMAGPREALWHAIIRRNYGANYFIVGRDHASPGIDSSGKPFYGTLEAQELFTQFENEIGVKMLAFNEMVYLPEEDRYEETDKIENNAKTFALSGTQIREDFLYKGKILPEWFTHQETAEILAESYPPRHKQGFCLWFTGLSGSGKSTTTELLTTILMEKGRRVTVLDGDVVRTHLSKGLGFSKDDRDTNILRIGFVASEIARHGGAVICATVSPYLATRNEVRNLVGKDNFIEIFVDTPLEICEQRDTKGMYAKARRGEIKNFTGIDDIYETPLSPEIVLDTVNFSANENSIKILSYLENLGFVKSAEK